MATTIYYGAISLDGYLAGPDDDLRWLLDYSGSYVGDDAEGDPMGAGGSYEGFYAGVEALVMGSATYRWILDHLDAAGGGAWPYEGKPTWVLSSRDLPLPAGDEVDVRLADAPVRDLYPAMASAAGDGTLWIVGGGTVASQFADEGLLDEVHLTIVPIILGAGKPAFERPLPGGPLQLAGTRAFRNGMVELRYTTGA
jgi:dihydrofolate reductase